MPDLTAGEFFCRANWSIGGEIRRYFVRKKLEGMRGFPVRQNHLEGKVGVVCFGSEYGGSVTRGQCDTDHVVRELD